MAIHRLGEIAGLHKKRSDGLAVNVFGVSMNDMDVMNDFELGPSERSFIYAVARRVVRNDDVASDVTQDAMLLAFRHRDQFRGASAHRTWLYRIAVTTALGYLRKRRRSREELAASDRPLGVDAPDPQPSPEDVVAARQLATHVEDALGSIGDPYRAVFELRVEDVSEAEIAGRVGISVANVKIRAHRARQQLRAALDAAGGLDEINQRRARRAPRARRDTRADRTATRRAS